MIEDLRKQAGESQELEESDKGHSRSSGRRFLGMTPMQRFVIALMLLMTICLIGMFILMVTGKINLPVF
jgi:hypothetical protein